MKRSGSKVPGGRAGGRGSSLIELLVAAALLGVALLAVLPLFTRAALDVSSGSERSTAALLAGNGLEAWLPLAAASGARRREYYSLAERRWLGESPPPPDRVGWLRETSSVRYPLSAAADGRIERSEALGEGEPSTGIGLVAVRVTVARGEGPREMTRLERLEWISE